MRMAIRCLVFLLLGTGAAASPPGDQEPEVVETGRPAATGFYMGAGWSREYLKLDFDERATLPERDIAWEDWGTGITGAFGYGFGPRFRAEMALSGSWRDARPAGTSTGSGMARFTGYIPVGIDRGWQPYLIAGLCASVTLFQMKGSPDLTYLVTGGDMGAGVRVDLDRRWGLHLDYVHSVLDIQQEAIEKEGGGEDLRNVGRRGRLETLRIGLTRDF